MLLYLFTDSFKKVISATSVNKLVPFNFSSSFVQQYFGQKLNLELRYYEFCQVLQVNLSSIEVKHAVHHSVQHNDSTQCTIDILYTCVIYWGFQLTCQKSKEQEEPLNTKPIPTEAEICTL